MNFLGDWNDYPNNLISFISGTRIMSDLLIPQSGKKIMSICVPTNIESATVTSTRLFQPSFLF